MEYLQLSPEEKRMISLSSAGAAKLLSYLGISCMRKDGKWKNLSAVLREVHKKQEEMDPQLWDALIEKLKQEADI